MHVLFVADGDSKYGAPRSMYQLIENLVFYDENIKVSVVLTKKTDYEDKLRKLGCDVYVAPYVPYYQRIPERKTIYIIKYVLRGLKYFYGRLFSVKILSKQLDINSIDLIHSNSLREDFGVILSVRYNIPLVWHIREFGDLDYQCYSYRNNYIDFIKQADAQYIAISRAVKEHWVKKGIEQARITHIYNIVTIPPIENVEKKKHNYIDIIMMGSLHETKGQRQIIEAIALLGDAYKQKVHLDIVGDSKTGYDKVLKRIVEKEGIAKNVSFLGYKKDFYNNLVNYDVGVICSKSEALGRVTMEYMLAGLPVLASNSGANPELVSDGKNGLLYKWNDIKDLARRLEYIVDNTHELKEMGIYAKKYVTEHFKKEELISKVEAVYEKAMSSNKDTKIC